LPFTKKMPGIKEKSTMETINEIIKPIKTLGVYYLIRHDKLKNDKAPIYCRITVNGTITHFALKQSIDPKYWEDRNKVDQKSKREIAVLNRNLKKVTTSLENHYKRMQINGVYITAGIIKDAFLGRVNEEANTLSRLVNYHNEQAQLTLEWSTLKHYYVTQRYLTGFLKEKLNKSDVFLHEINYKFVLDFEIYLRAQKPSGKQKPLNNNVIMKHLIRLRKMTSLAMRLDWLKNNPFKNYKIRQQKVETDFLTKIELGLIEKKNLANEKLYKVQDIFVFCCYTGLAYIDVMNLNEENIIKGVDGEDWIKISRRKTNTSVNTPLLPKAKQILFKYCDDDHSITILPFFSNQKMNGYLKEIAKLCGIKKNLTTHIARHTFATTVTLSNGVPIETVSKMLGHTKIATTQIYARVLEKKIGEDMALLKAKLVNIDN